MRSRDVRTQCGGIAKLLLDRESGAPDAKSLLQGRALWSARLASWAEEDFLQHCSAQYCDSIGHPRSTIAANYSLDGTVVASTHGDHSVKLVDSYTGCKLQCLVGHVRTPWVVRFSPCTPDIVASGSLDYSVSVWQASQGQRLHHHSFGKPIASIAFHPSGHLLVVASGHKVYVWPYQAGLDSLPSVLLKTRRSLRALHFHPLGRPMLLTAEVVERRSSAADGAGWSNAATSSTVRVPGPVHEAASVRAEEPTAQPPGASRGNVTLGQSDVPHPQGELDAALAGQLMQMRLAGARRPEGLPMPCLAEPAELALVPAEPGSPSMESQPGVVAAPPLVNGSRQAEVRADMATPAARPPAAGVPQGLPHSHLHLEAAPDRLSTPCPAQPACALSAPCCLLQDQGGRQAGSCHVPASTCSQLRVTAEQQPGGEGREGSSSVGQQASSSCPQAVPSASASVSGDPQDVCVPAILDGMQPTTPWRAGRVNQQQQQQQCTPPPPPQQQHTSQDQQQQQVEQGAQQQPAGPPQGLQLSPTIGHSPSSPRPWLAPSPARPATPSRQPSEEAAAVPTLPLLVPMVPSHPAGPVYSPAWAWERGSGPPGPSLPPAGPTQHGRLGQEQAQGARAASLLTAQAAARAMAETAAAATAAAVRAAGSSQADQPCLVNLCLWPFDVQQPRQPLGQPLLVVPGTVLCSEMGTHFSPCGRLLAMCVAVEGPSPACTQWMAEHQAKPPPLQGQQQQQQQQQQRHSSPQPPRERQQQQQQAQPSHQQQQQQDQPQLQQQQQGRGPGASHLDPLGCRPNRSGQSLTSPSRTIGPHPTAATTAATPASSAASPPDAPLQPPHARLGAPGPTPTNAAAPPPPSLTPGAPPPLHADHEACPLYELRIYSVAPGPSFGQVVAARPLLAAHCLTSLQFSPTSEHLLLAYGRRHLSLCSLVLEAGGLTPVHTVIEVYRVADLALVRLLPSKEDEVNCAAWSPLPGGGLMYGTKEGKLRLLRHDRLLPSEPSLLPGAASSTADEELWDAERRAPGSATEEDDG